MNLFVLFCLSCVFFFFLPLVKCMKKRAFLSGAIGSVVLLPQFFFFCQKWNAKGVGLIRGGICAVNVYIMASGSCITQIDIMDVSFVESVPRESFWSKKTRARYSMTITFSSWRELCIHVFVTIESGILGTGPRQVALGEESAKGVLSVPMASVFVFSRRCTTRFG